MVSAKCTMKVSFNGSDVIAGNSARRSILCYLERALSCSHMPHAT